MTLAWTGAMGAGGLEAIREQAELTPEGFIRQFADFTYELGDRVQDPERFLERKRGDCDDFARLASLLLEERGYKTKVVVVMMARETHVVCYVTEAAGFLDYNHRAKTQPVVLSDGTLEDIAHKVASEFRSHWRMASEVRFEEFSPVFVNSVFYNQPEVLPADPAASEIESIPAAVSGEALASTVKEPG